jgi:hypothetical protein
MANVPRAALDRGDSALEHDACALAALGHHGLPKAVSLGRVARPHLALRCA